MIKRLAKSFQRIRQPVFTRHFNKHRALKAGLPPGQMVHIGKKRTEKVKIHIIDYSGTKFQEREIYEPKSCKTFSRTKTVTWINVTGVHDTKIIAELGECFNLHPLLLEDIVNTDQRPKVEDFGDYLFIVLKMLLYDEQKNSIIVEQVSLVIGSNFVISFQEVEGDIFDLIRNRIRTSKGRFRNFGPDYLAYALIDAVVDHYFVILEKIGEDIEDLEEAIAKIPRQSDLPQLHTMKREMIFLRKAVWPLREVVSSLQRGESKLIKNSTKIYLRDVYDHTIQVIDTVETFRDILSGMLDLYLSSISNKMNEVMKVLTIFAAVFIPLTFIAGVYGMNFEGMPELKWKYGYFYALGLMLAVGGTLLIYFKRKKWF